MKTFLFSLAFFACIMISCNTIPADEIDLTQDSIVTVEELDPAILIVEDTTLVVVKDTLIVLDTKSVE